MSNISNNTIEVSVKNLYKTFGNITGLSNLTLDIFKGEVLALVGDNGSGKSTFVKILSGVYKPSSGEIKVNNTIYKSLSIKSSLNFGITTIYQDLALVETLSVWENIFLGRELKKFKVFIDSSKMISKTITLLKSLNVDIKDVTSKVQNLSGGQRQCIAVARAINQGGKIIIMDEPTAAMGFNESQRVYNLINNLKSKRYTIIVICHNMNTVFDISDKIAIMKSGNLVGLYKTIATTPNEVINIISSNN